MKLRAKHKKDFASLMDKMNASERRVFMAIMEMMEQQSVIIDKQTKLIRRLNRQLFKA